MPELPEVETIRKGLSPICGQTIVSVQLSRLAPVETTTPARVRKTLIGATIAVLRRWGKYLLIDTDRNETLVIHLGMSGRLLLNPPSPPFVKGGLGGFSDHRHMNILLSDNYRLALTDPRRFGTISLSFQPDGSDNRFLQRLGPDYLDASLTPEFFIERCRRHPGLSLKSLLLHQGVASGLGNIYACEALYRARLNPKRRLCRVKNDELIRLLHAIRDCLTLAIQKGGTTLRDYRDSVGQRGRMKGFLQIYGQSHAKRIEQGGRSTWYNPEVQK